MNQLGFPLLSIVVFLPLAGALMTLGLGARRRTIKAWALTVTLVDLVLAGALWAVFDYGEAGMQLVDRATWIEPLGIDYFVGIDGVSLWLLLLSALLSMVTVLASWRFLDSRPESDARAFMALLLALETGVLGVFAAVDLVLFYVFWEAMLVPMYFLIGRWGGERRAYATLKFFLYTLAGSALMLVAIVVLAVLHYQATGAWTFSLVDLLFLAFGLAFAVKSPIFPLHTWLPDAYVEAPTPATLMLAGVLSKMGVYGFIRFCLPLFPSAVAVMRPWVWLLALAGLLYGSLVALAQQDAKRLVAYSSLAHMGMLVAGAFAGNVQGVQGALIYALSHGVTVTGLFLVVDMLEARRGTRELGAFGGLWQRLPLLGSLTLALILGSIGLPGLSGFVGEFTMLVGLFQTSPVAAVFAALGIVLGAWYMLNLFRQVFVGPMDKVENQGLPDVRRTEAALLVPLAGLVFVLGLLPGLFFQPMEKSVDRLLSQAEARVVQVEAVDRLAER
jgi:NADH-quinone oxidoreductase subunit M